MLLRNLHLRLFCSAVIIFFFIPLYSQDEEKSEFSAGADLFFPFRFRQDSAWG